MKRKSNYEKRMNPSSRRAIPPAFALGICVAAFAIAATFMLISGLTVGGETEEETSSQQSSQGTEASPPQRAHISVSSIPGAEELGVLPDDVREEFDQMITEAFLEGEDIEISSVEQDGEGWTVKLAQGEDYVWVWSNASGVTELYRTTGDGRKPGENPTQGQLDSTPVDSSSSTSTSTQISHDGTNDIPLTAETWLSSHLPSSMASTLPSTFEQFMASRNVSVSASESAIVEGKVTEGNDSIAVQIYAMNADHTAEYLVECTYHPQSNAYEFAVQS